jgi:hypothetical protein
MKQKNAMLAVVFLVFPALCCEEGCQGDRYAETRQRCVDRINELRDSVGLPPYERWMDGESCADDEAKRDGEANRAHGAFGSCGEWAQNECPGWGSLDSIVSGCLDLMWSEGPGADFATHGHYINMTSTSYTGVACGFHVMGDGSVWSVQNFR